MTSDLLYYKARQVYPNKKGVIARLYTEDTKWRGIVTCWPDEKKAYYKPITLLLTKKCASRQQAIEALDKLLDSEECKNSSQVS